MSTERKSCLSLNGIPVATIELKNPLTGQTVEDARRQYKQDRDPREPIFEFKRRTLVHFAVDTEAVLMTTRLAGSATHFLPSTHRLRPGMFVAQVVGKSMEPTIPDGSYCLFAAPVAGTRQGKTVLVQLRDAADPETGERYTVKRYESEKVPAEGSCRHAKITLKPNNPEFAPIELSNADEGQLQVIAEFLEVLGGG